MYHSEHGQDEWLNDNIFKNKREGIFVEFGAIDGVLHSNSLFFEEELNWTGVLVEPNPDEYKKLVMNRFCKCFNYGISDKKDIIQYMQIEGGLVGWGGFTDFMEIKHLDRIKKHVPNESIRYLDIDCITLNKLLDIAKIKKVDYMSIDVEGAEYKILQAFNFEKYDIKIFDIENNFGAMPIETLMNSKGYRKIKTLDINDIYTKVV